MATIPVSSGSIMRPRRNSRVRSFREAASQSFKLGEIVVLNTTTDKGNQIIKGASDPSAGTVVGVAASDASGVENTLIPVWMADEEQEFVAHCEDAAAIDNDDVGNSYGVVFDASNRICRVDRSDTSNTVVKVTELVDAHGDVNGRLAFKFLNASRAVLAS